MGVFFVLQKIITPTAFISRPMLHPQRQQFQKLAIHTYIFIYVTVRHGAPVIRR